MIKNINLESLAKSRITTWLESSMNLLRIIKAIIDQAQTLDDEIVELIHRRFLDVATGAALEQWGRLLGEPRLGKPDDDYRRAIVIRILRNTTNATPNRMIRILVAMAGAQNARYTDLGSAVFGIDLFGAAGTAEMLKVAKEAIGEAKPAGVGFYIGASSHSIVFGTDGQRGHTGGFAGLNEPGTGAPLASIVS